LGIGRSKRVLVYRIGQIGDTVIALPALRAVRAHFSGAHIALLTDTHTRGQVPARSVLPEAGLFDEWLSYPAATTGSSAKAILSVLPTLWKRRFDTLVYLAPRLRTHNQITRDLLFFRLAGIRHFIGHQGFQSLPSVNPGDPLPRMEHEADHLLNRLAASGVPVPRPGEGSLDLALTQDEQLAADRWLDSHPARGNERRVAICPGSKWASKVWPEPYYAELGRRLIAELDVDPVVFGGPEDAAVAERLIGGWGRGSCAAGALSVRQSAAALRRCDLYVGNDTGAMHLAAAVGTPCVAVFSAQDWPGRWYPYGPGHTILRRSVSCEGCLLSVCTEQGLRC
jgi:ADP-heptose:LPS heptosyltransferase